jgi:glycosyltransferase involved in cell wall biosynthesis
MAFLDQAVRVMTVGHGHITATARLSRILRQEKPDVIFAALGASNLKMTCASILAGRPSALILTYHGRFSVEQRPLGKLGYMLTPLLTRVADQTLAVSADLAEYIVRTWHADRRSVAYIHNPIFITNANQHSETKPLSDRADIVLAAGRLSPEKDFESLIRAFAKLDRPSARLIILGEGPHRQVLQAEVKRLGLDGRVDLPGYITVPWPYFRQAKCFALTSKSEAFGNVLVEALSYGLPVVSTRCGGPEEILEQGRYGALVPVGDVDAIAAELDFALQDRGDCQLRMERAGTFSVQVVTARYERLIELVIAGQRM